MRAMGRRGMVASPHYLATGAGLDVLRRGGSALDAAIATNAVLAVVMPYACGIGGDLFAIVYQAEDQSLVGLNGSGRAPAEATPERVRALAESDVMPARGPLPITVPGCVEAWGRLHERFGRLPLAEVLGAAVEYADDGFPVTDHFVRALARSEPFLHPETPARETFFPNGHLPREGQVLRQPRLARTLRAIAAEGPAAYYRGPIAAEIARAVRSVGGLLSEEDLARHESNWVQPLSLRYRDVDIFELPPNSQGVIALAILNILRWLPEDAVRQFDERYVHVLAEAARLAYADRQAYLTDPDHMTLDPATLLDDDYGRRQAATIGEQVAGQVLAGEPAGTIYLCAADGEGNLVSLIESNYMGIGSGVMAGETGVMLQNRGAWFSLDPVHVNVIAPRKRTMHTLMPGMAFRAGRPWLVFGTEGGSAQPQIHVQILTKLIDQGLPLDEAIAAPRFDAVVGGDDDGRPAIRLEAGFPGDVHGALRDRGHGPTTSAVTIGTSHAIQILDDGVYVGAADPRTYSLALGY